MYWYIFIRKNKKELIVGTGKVEMINDRFYFILGCCQSLSSEKGPSSCDISGIQSDFILL